MTRARDLADLLTGGQTIETDDNTVQITLKSTDADATSGPVLSLVRDSGSPADSDVVGEIRFNADNDAGQETEMANIFAQIGDASDGTEDAALITRTMLGGTMKARISHLVSETVFNEDSADLDFRVESDANTHALFLEGSTGNVGIGTSSPDSSHELEVSSTGTAEAGIRSGNTSEAILNFGRTSDRLRGRIAYNNSSEYLAFWTNQGEKMRLDSSGNLLVGTTTNDIFDSSSEVGSQISDGYLAVARASTVAYFNRLTSDGEIVSFRKDGSAVGSISAGNGDLRLGTGDIFLRFFDAGTAFIPRTAADATSNGVVDLGNASNHFKNAYFTGTVFAEAFTGRADTDTSIQMTGSDIIKFFTNSSEKARFISNSTPHFLVGCTSSPSASVAGTAISTTDAGSFQSFSGTTNASTHAVFGNPNGTQGHIQTNANSTSYFTTSDRRLKSNIQDAASASSKIDAMKVRQFDWKADDTHQDYGLIAQELQTVEPLAVSGDADSDNMMSVDYSKLVPMLLKEIQELRSRVATLEAS